MDIEDLAMCILDRLMCTPEDRRRGLMTRDQFINHHVTEAFSAIQRQLQPRGTIVTYSDAAQEAFPDYVKALAEAWSFLESRGYLVRHPAPRTDVFIGKQGAERHGMLRGTPRATVARPQEEREPEPDPPSSEPGIGGAEPSPTAAVLWAHSDPDWTETEEKAWENTVVSFVSLLRTAGIDADLDLYHGHTATDWARFGPRAIQKADFVLVAVSRTWRQAWEDDLSLPGNAGAVGEANALRGLFREDRVAFHNRVILVLLPGRDEGELPLDLRATSHWSKVPSLTEDGIEDLLRRLTAQPAHPKPPLGSIPSLPPRSGVESDGTGSNLRNQLNRADAALSELPPASSGSASEPWDEARATIESRREALLRELAALEGAPAPVGRPPIDPPRLAAHRQWQTGTFNMRLPAGPLHAHLVNEGGSAAEVLDATLVTPFGDFPAVMWVEEKPPLAPTPGPSAHLPPDGDLTLAFGENQLAQLPRSHEPLRMRVRYQPEGVDVTYEFRLSLHRAGAAPNARPQWKARNPETVVIG